MDWNASFLSNRSYVYYDHDRNYVYYVACLTRRVVATEQPLSSLQYSLARSIVIAGTHVEYRSCIQIKILLKYTVHFE